MLPDVIILLMLLGEKFHPIISVENQCAPIENCAILEIDYLEYRGYLFERLFELFSVRV
jgi:hypothetical protein